MSQPLRFSYIYFRINASLFSLKSRLTILQKNGEVTEFIISPLLVSFFDAKFLMSTPLYQSVYKFFTFLGKFEPQKIKLFLRTSMCFRPVYTFSYFIHITTHFMDKSIWLEGMFISNQISIRSKKKGSLPNLKRFLPWIHRKILFQFLKKRIFQ